ncbi:hypothetical protein GCM10027051_13070 [Niabella terrae]
MVMLLGVFQVRAQKEILFAVKGGISFNTLELKEAPQPELQDWRLSFHAGLVADIALNRLLTLRTGLDLQTQGGNYETVLEKNGKLNAMYLELPVNLLLKKDLGAVALYLGLGPYIDFGIGGKNKFSVLTAAGDEVAERIHWTDQPPVLAQPGNAGYLQRFQYGANAVAGLVLSDQIGLNLQYSHGLNNARPGAGDHKFRSLDAGIIVFL